jgi:hypothetical protein
MPIHAGTKRLEALFSRILRPETENQNISHTATSEFIEIVIMKGVVRVQNEIQNEICLHSVPLPVSASLLIQYTVYFLPYGVFRREISETFG